MRSNDYFTSEVTRKASFPFAFHSFFRNSAIKDDCNLLQAEKEYARETLQDLLQEAADEQQRLYEEFEKKRKELDESLAEKRKEYFYDEESSAIKVLMFKFARLAATSIEHVAQWLVWLAKELGQLTNMELHRADTEVRDIVEGKYDWRIERFENHRGDGLSV